MSWRDNIHGELSKAMSSNNLEGFRALLQAHPDNLRFSDGREIWLHLASQRGLQPFVELLVDLGIGVDEPVSSTNDATPLDRAAGAGQLEVCRWLVEHGARIKPDHLIKAVLGDGHLELVKYLVEQGVDIHAGRGSRGAMNALMYAEAYGRREVAEFLKSLGARDLRETTPKDFPASHKRWLEHIADNYGPLSDFRIVDHGDPRLELRCTVPDEEDGTQTLFTVGLSDRELEVSSEKKIEIEIKLLLPKDWPLTDESLADPKWNWPVEHLRRIAREALDSGRWPGAWYAVFMNGEPPQPLAPNTQLSGWLCLMRQGASCPMPDARWVDDCTMFPIYAEERDLIESAGYEALLQRFHDRDLPQHLDPTRPNAGV